MQFLTKDVKMRMWNVSSEMLCRKHLIGEHAELHMFLGCIKKGTSLKGYLDKGLVEVHNIKKRHDELVIEMIERGYNHKTPLEDFDCCEIGCVNTEQNIRDLSNRCENCRERIKDVRSETRNSNNSTPS